MSVETVKEIDIIKPSLAKKLKTVYTIIVTYNAMQWIDKCLQSLTASSYKTKIILIDNGSKDNTVSHIRNAYPSVELIIAGKNLGFGQGNNIGLSIAAKEKADYCFLLNQDAWIETNTIEQLVTAHIENPSFGIISPVHLNGQGSDFDEHFYEYLLQSNIKGILWHSITEKTQQTKLIQSPFVNAACWLISSACLKSVGGFDPVFFHYGEDDNYGQRVLYKGFKTGIHPAAIVYHDKERPSKQTVITPEKKMYKEWVQFLVYASDVHRSKYRLFIIRRACSCFFQSLVGFCTLKWQEALYQSKLGFRILSAFPRISRSQTQSVSNVPYLHLEQT